MRDERKLPNDDYADSNSPSASLSALPPPPPPRSRRRLARSAGCRRRARGRPSLNDPTARWEGSYAWRRGSLVGCRRLFGCNVLRCGLRTLPLSIREGWSRTSAGMPSPVCSCCIILSERGRLRLSISDTRARLPMKGSRSRRVKPRLSM